MMDGDSVVSAASVSDVESLLDAAVSASKAQCMCVSLHAGVS